MINKKTENNKTIYSIESDIDVPLKVKTNKKDTLVQKIINNVAYAVEGSLDAADQRDYSVMHQRIRVYWNYITDGNGLRYVKYTKLQAYWNRDDTRLTVNRAQFGAGLIGNQYGGGGISKSWWGSNFVPTWTASSNYLNTDVIVNTTGDFVNWPYIWPADQISGNNGQVLGDIYNSYGLVATLYSQVKPY